MQHGQKHISTEEPSSTISPSFKFTVKHFSIISQYTIGKELLARMSAFCLSMPFLVCLVQQNLKSAQYTKYQKGPRVPGFADSLSQMRPCRAKLHLVHVSMFHKYIVFTENESLL